MCGCLGPERRRYDFSGAGLPPGPNIAPDAKLLQKRLRAEGLQLKACRRSRFATASNVVDALLPASGAAYEHESTWLKPADHQFWGQDNSRLFSALRAASHAPKTLCRPTSACLSVGSLDRELLKVVLKELLPSATFDDGVVAFAAQNNSTTSRPPLKALFDIARNKVRAKRDGEQRLKEPRDIEHWRLYKDSVSATRWCGRAGRFCGFVRRWPALAATRRVRWEPQSRGLHALARDARRLPLGNASSASSIDEASPVKH